MLRNLSIACLVAATILAIQPTEAQAISDPGMLASCAPPYQTTGTASIGGGLINWCVYYPDTVMPGATFNVFSVLTGPTSTAPVFSAATDAFSASSGCTEGTPSRLTPAVNGVVGIIVTYTSTFTMAAGSESCRGNAFISLTVGTVPQEIYTTAIPMAILTENVRVDNFDYLCDAPAIAPNSYSTTATTCNDPNIALSGSLTLAGVPDTQEELQAVADAIAAGLTVQFGNASFGNMTVPTTIRVESSTAETALPLLLLLAAFVFAGYRLLERPWRWLWVFGILTVGFFVYVFNEEKLNLTAVVGFLGGLWVIVLLLNKFGFGKEPENP
jgi:hypothetical protein